MIATLVAFILLAGPGSAGTTLIGEVTAISSFSLATANRPPASAVNGSGLNTSATPDAPDSENPDSSATLESAVAKASATEPLPNRDWFCAGICGADEFN